jgi:putative exosortase-associated protein (TIGR04073 family)
MKTAGRLSLVLVCGAVLLAARLSAAEDNYANGMTEKFCHGLVSIATGWLEVPLQVKKGYDRGVSCVKPCAGSKSLGALLGVGRGVSHTLGRTAWGALELATFWAPNHTTNADLQLLQDSFYPWEEGTLKPFRCPAVKDGAHKLAMRFERGLDDLVGSLLEIPGQIRKADASGNFLPGIPKGLYCTVGRMVNGAGDIVLIALPSPVDNLMVPFDEVKPWDAYDGKYYSNLAPAASK